MRSLPSAQLRKFKKTILDENDYLENLNLRAQYLESFSEAINSPFGKVLITALDNLERSAYLKLGKTMRWRTILQARAEIAVAQYLKTMFIGMLNEKASVDAEIQQYQGELDESN